MERIPLHLEDYVGKLNEELARHPECLPGMQIIIQRLELKYSYEICDPTRDPTKPGSLKERMQADRVFKEVVAKVNEKYELIRP
jgi:hypothetical protein